MNMTFCINTKTQKHKNTKTQKHKKQKTNILFYFYKNFK